MPFPRAGCTSRYLYCVFLFCRWTGEAQTPLIGFWPPEVDYFQGSRGGLVLGWVVVSRHVMSSLSTFWGVL